ncbi:MAG: hypothetical protein WBZ42_09825 [Halobacteriota archaeon]
MQPEELRARLLELGADVPSSTLRRWASNKEGLIPKPLKYTKPLNRGPGRPGKKDRKEPQAHPGLFSDWTHGSLEAAAAVWSIRHLARPTDSTEDNLLSIKETSQKDVSKSDIVQGQQMARSLHILLYTDCKEAANRFRAYLWPQGLPSQEADQGKKIYFGEDRRYSLIPVCINAFEKVRHRIALSMPVSITYKWTIREDGSSAFTGISLQREYVYYSEIKLQITHLRPCENGFSRDYGFPHVKEYIRDGFVDEFWMKGTELGERFAPSRFGGVPDGFYEVQTYADYWDKDPYGWGERATEYYDEDQE